MGLQGFFARHPVFTHQEFVAFSSAEEPRSVKTLEALLAYHCRTGRIVRVRRGLFIVVPPGVKPNACPVDPYLLAAKMSDDAVLAYHTALEFHGKAYSVTEQFQYLTNRASRPLVFRSQRFRGVLFPKKLRDKKEDLYGVKESERAGLIVRVTSFERTLVDVLDRPDLGGSWEEIWRSLESVEFFELEQVIKYAILLGNATTVAKVGFFLEQHRDTLMANDSHLERLRECRPNKPHYMERNGKRAGRFMAHWNLVVPENVSERSWEEIL